MARCPPVEKLEVHQRGLRHQAISVFVMAGTQVLLQQRALTKYHSGGKWSNTCCTHPRWGEAFADCVQRRLQEELGITGLTLEHVDQIEYRADVGGGLTEHELVEVYVAQAPLDLPLALNPDEVEAAQWVDLDSSSPMLPPRQRPIPLGLRSIFATMRAGFSGCSRARERDHGDSSPKIHACLFLLCAFTATLGPSG